MPNPIVRFRVLTFLYLPLFNLQLLLCPNNLRKYLQTLPIQAERFGCKIQKGKGAGGGGENKFSLERQKISMPGPVKVKADWKTIVLCVAR